MSIPIVDLADVDSNYPKLYDDCTAGEYLDERPREIGLKKIHILIMQP